jgi:predicted Zn-dependent peptidase
LRLNDLPDDYWNTYLSRIGAMDNEAVAQAVAELIDPDRMVEVVVGDAEKVQKELEEIAEVDLVTTGG